MNARPVLLILFLVTIVLASCEKGPGEGGTNTIRGRVMVMDYNKDYTILRGIHPGMKEDVYIIYGGDYVYGDKFETGDSGQYEFKYLRAGTYTVYAYSDDTLDVFDLSTAKIAVKQTVEVSGKDQTVEVPDIFIAK